MQTNLLKPKAIHVEPLGGFRAKATLEPFERGYGHTLGNALRRVLLSSIPGFAITEVEIDGVLHEYTTVEGLQEDVLEVLLNLKDVAIRMHNGDSATLTLSRQGPGVVVAGDIKTDHNVEILNVDHVICHLTKDTALNMRLKIERGFGYQCAPPPTSSATSCRCSGTSPTATAAPPSRPRPAWIRCCCARSTTWS